MRIPYVSWIGAPAYQWRKSRAAAAAGLLTVLLVLSISHPVGAAAMLGAGPATDSATEPQAVPERPDRVSAALTARLQKSRVLVTDETTESTLTYVNPDGTITLEASSGLARIKQGEEWTPVDTSLVAEDGVYKPRAAFGDLEISAGGNEKPLIRLRPEEGKAFALWAPSKLPAPVIQGSKAVYRDAAGPGADLVVTALSAGVQHDVILRQRPPGPVEFRFRIKTEGLKLTKTKVGTLQLKTEKGKVYAAAPRPLMSDTKSAPLGLNDAARSPSAKIGNVALSIVTTGDHGQEMILRPDSKYLADPATTYPVTVDPAMTLPMGEGVSIHSPCPDGDMSMSPGLEVGLISWVCSTNWSAKVFYRSLLDFDTRSLVGQEVHNARLDLVGDLWGCPTGQQLKVQRITSNWDPDWVFWDTQPRVTDNGAVVSTPPAICTPASALAADVPWSIPVTDIAKTWAAGTQGHGLMLRATVEDKTRPEFDWTFQRTHAELPKLIVTYGGTPWVEHPRTVPVASPTREIKSKAGEEPKISGRLFTTTTQPTLHTGVRGTGATLRADFQVEHDPAVAGQGSGLIWAGSVDDVPAGEVAKISVPEGVLNDGWRIRWRSRAVDGNLESAWTQWQRVSIDATRPAEPEVTCTNVSGEGAWGRRATTSCILESPSKDVTEYIWEFDNPLPSTIEEAGIWEDSLGETRTIERQLADGWHTLYVKTRDKAHNTSDTVAFRLGIGPGGLITAQKQTRTHRTVTLDAAAPPNRNKVTYEYSTNFMPWATWRPVPPQDVFVPGSETPITAWPQVRTDTSKDFSGLSWDLAKTLKTSQEREGVVRLRACFSGGSSAEECSEPTEISLSRSAISDSHAISDVGPGVVALLNGDYSLKITDASEFGVQVDRTHRTLNPAFESAVLDEAKVFGPGWLAGFPAAPSWVSAFVPSEEEDKGWIQLIGPNGTTYTYTKHGSVYTGVDEAADGTVITATNEELTVTDRAGAKTTYVKVDEEWVVARTEGPAAESAVTYFRDNKARITRILAPVAGGISCGTTLTPGCRALELSYASTTTATGVASGWGDFKDQVKSLSLTAFDPDTNAMRTTELANYTYDSTGHLRQVTDPRTSLVTVYYYTGEGRISQITPPGLAPWRFEYDAGGRLAHVQREGGDVDPTWAIVYDVPIGGSAAPIDLTLSETTRWGQTVDLPVVGTALFPASHLPPRRADGAYVAGADDWEYSSLTYIDSNGRGVNTAAFGAGTWQIDATRYDENGNVIWHLSRGNRVLALTPTEEIDPYTATRFESAERASLLATVSQYNVDGDLTSSVEPTRLVVLADGQMVSARLRTTHEYDVGKPVSDINYHLPTTTKSDPLVVDGVAVPSTADSKTTVFDYDPVISGDASGWAIRKPTVTTTVVPGQDAIKHRVRYDAAGREIERRMPSSSGSDAGSIASHYYTAGPHPTVEDCGNRPAWAGWSCRVTPVAQPSTGSPLAVQHVSGYDFYGLITTKSEYSGSAVRRMTNTYDAAGRSTRANVEVTPETANDIAFPEMRYVYDSTTGLQVRKEAGNEAIVITYDSFARPVTTTDAAGNTATTTYDLDGRIVTSNDGKGVTTFTYNGPDATGKIERRGLITKIDSGAGEFSGAYDAAGSLAAQVYPNGLTATSAYDSNGKRTRLSYEKENSVWLNFSAMSDVLGRTVTQQGPAGSQEFRYDAVGRLERVQDTFHGQCTTRSYGFSKNSNRTSLTVHPADDSGQCSVNTTPTVTNYNYDEADRLTNPGYAYDEFGRTVSVPASDVTGGTSVSLGYFSTDTVASVTQDGITTTYDRDPIGRVKSATTTRGGDESTVTSYYSGLEDSPAWISEADGTWSRYILGLEGLSGIQNSAGSVVLQLTNMHGDIVSTVTNEAGSAGVDEYEEATEYGASRDLTGSKPAKRYGWLGGKQRAADVTGGFVLMGARVYNPLTGRFLQRDPVPGGSANAYDYCNADPIGKVDLTGTVPGDKEEQVGYTEHRTPVKKYQQPGYENAIEITATAACAVVGGPEGAAACLLAFRGVEVFQYVQDVTRIRTYVQRNVKKVGGFCKVTDKKCSAYTEVWERNRVVTERQHWIREVTYFIFRWGSRLASDTGWRMQYTRVNVSYTPWRLVSRTRGW